MSIYGRHFERLLLQFIAASTDRVGGLRSPHASPPKMVLRNAEIFTDAILILQVESRADPRDLDLRVSPSHLIGRST